MSSYLNQNKKPTRESIIGLGEGSIRKNYYPELQDKLNVLEKMRARNHALIMAIPDVLLVSNSKLHLSPFSATTKQEISLTMSILRNTKLVECLKLEVQKVIELSDARVFLFDMPYGEENKNFEARLTLTEMDEVLIIIRDITEQIKLENKLRHLAETDYLTGIFNRRKFEESLEDLEGTDAYDLAILVFDIDGLKNINDTLGHPEGDRVICHVSKAIKHHFSDAYSIGRIGGNEFGVSYINTSIQSIELKCDAMIKDLVTPEFAFEISISFGIAHSRGKTIELNSLFQQADSNMYKNKLLKASSSKSVLVKSLMKALEAKDYITEGHAERMDFLAEKLAQALSFERYQMDQIALLAKFHDIGKVGIPDNILKKEGPLTKEEWVIMEKHTEIGQRIASVTPELSSISELILKHHEKWDGSGYPLGLSGDDIPIECRILALVDSFDAMTNDRPYRKALTLENAIAEVKRCSGSQFDPNLVELFISIVYENKKEMQ